MPSDHDTIGPVQPKRLASSLLAENGVEDVTSALQDLEAFATLTTNLEGVSVALRNLCIRTTVINSLHGVADVLDERTQTLFADTAAFNELLGPLIQEIEQGDGTIEPALLEDIEAKYHEVLSRPTYRMYFAGLLLDALDTDDPEAIHYATVDRIIDTDALPDDGLDKARDALARELCNACRGLAKTAHIFRRTTFEDQIPDNGLPRAEFDAPLASHDESGRIYAGSRSTGEMNLDTAEGNALMPKFAAGAAGEMLWLDAAGIAWAEHGFAAHPKEGSADKERSASEGPFGSAHSKPLEAMVEDARSRWEQYGDNPSPELLKWWADPDEDIPTHIPLVDLACEHFWKDKILPEWEREQRTPDHPLTERVGGDDYNRFGRAYAGTAPDFGKTVTAGEDGDEYRCTPADLTPYHVHDAVSTQTRSAPHQQLLPRVDVPSAGKLVKAGSQQVLTVPEGKLLVRFALETRRPSTNLAAEHRYDGQSTVGELAEEIFPHYKRLNPEQFEIVARATRRISDEIYLRIPYESGTNRVPAFIVEHPDDLTNVSPDQPVRWKAAPQLFKKLREHDAPFRDGAIVFNRTKFMRLNGRQALDLRAYMIAAAAWNRARDYSTGELVGDLRFTDAKWAYRINAYSPRGVEYYENPDTNSRDDRTGYQRYREGRQKARESLERLEGEGLVVVDGDLDDTFRVLPPDALNEAWQKFRQATSTRVR